MKTAKAAVDTSAFIAAVCSWHEKHAATVTVIEGLLGAGVRLTMPTHALLESYAVLTRLPAPHRLRPIDALALLERNAAVFPECTAPKAKARKFLHEWAGAEVAGGRVYDLFILETSRAAGARTFVTLNPKDILGFEGGMQIIVP